MAVPITIALAPTAPGNFTVAHGQSATPIYAIIQMTSGGEIWFQTPQYDATNLYLVASDAGITGNAIVFPAAQAAGCIQSTSGASTITVQKVANSARAYPDLTPVLGTSGWEQEPALTIANDVMQRILAQGMDWKWNRSKPSPFLTIALQQDYVTTINNLGWLEQCWRQDINNSAIPQPIFGMESVRDIAKTSYQANPFNISWVYNYAAIMGTWQARTAYPSGLGMAMTPASPYQQFIDANGNILFVTGNGVSGSVQPALPANSSQGTNVVDGTVTWTCADPRSIAFRLGPLPATSGIVWQVQPVYQVKPPRLTSLQCTIAPIPDEYAYLFRQGFMALCYGHAGSKKFQEVYAMWEEALMTALRSADREREDASFYPSESLMGGGPYKYGMPVGPAWPFDYWGQ